MKVFAGDSRIERLPLPARLVYTFFIVFMIIGFVSSLFLYQDGIGWRGDQVSTWYRGDDAQMAFPKSFRQMMETFHFHLFTVPVCYLIVAHLFMLGSMGRRWKLFWICAGFASTLFHLFAPWVAWKWPSPAGWVMPATGAFFLVSWVVMLSGPLWDMWAGSFGKQAEEQEG